MTDRRSFLRGASVLLGHAAFGPGHGGVRRGAAQGHLLLDTELSTLRALVDVILPGHRFAGRLRRRHSLLHRSRLARLRERRGAEHLSCRPDVAWRAAASRARRRRTGRACSRRARRRTWRSHYEQSFFKILKDYTLIGLFPLRSRAPRRRWRTSACRADSRAICRSRPTRKRGRSDGRPNHFDAIVVGSGMSGGWAAKELTEKGLKTLVLERGREHPPRRRLSRRRSRTRGSCRTTIAPPPPTRRRSRSSRRSIYTTSRPSSISSTTSNIPTSRRSRSTGIAAITWAAARSCGRGTCSATAISISTANQREGVGIDWPIRYADIAPWYEHVERFIGASGENSELPQLPEQILQPPFEMNALEKHIRARIVREGVHATASSSAAPRPCCRANTMDAVRARDATNARAVARTARISPRTA